MEQCFPASTVLLPSGAQVAVRQCGQRSGKPSIVLLHGISSGAPSWLHPALLLAEHHHVLAWDAPGYGDSTPLPEAVPTVEAYAQRLDALLRAQDITSCVLVGHSLGALMGAAYAAGAGRHGVQRLVLISPAGGYGAADAADQRERVRDERRGALRTLGVDGIAERIPARLLSTSASAADRAWVQWNASRLHAKGYLQAVELLCNTDLGAYCPMGVPVEVHCGDADVVTPPAQCAAWAAALAAPFALISDAGHASPVQQPVAVARLVATAATDNPDHG
jgi:pimeloyl-ACP methyl ester carboxylesterase